MVNEIKSNIKKNQIKKKQKYGMLKKVLGSNDNSTSKLNTTAISIESSNNNQKSKAVKQSREPRIRTNSNESYQLNPGNTRASEGDLNIVEDNSIIMDKRGSSNQIYQTSDIHGSLN